MPEEREAVGGDGGAVQASHAARTPVQRVLGGRRRKIVIAFGFVLVVIPAVVYAIFALQTTDALPTAKLPPPPADSKPGELAGRWAVSGSADDFVGYRVREKVGPLPAPDDAVGRTHVVRGVMQIEGDRIVRAEIVADMSEVRSDAPRDITMQTEGLESDRFPNATGRLAEAVDLGSPPRGQVFRVDAPLDFTLHGVTRRVRFPLAGRWNGDSIQMAGRARIKLADFGMRVRARLGFHISDSGTIEVELMFVRPSKAKRPARGQPGAVPLQEPKVSRRALAAEPVASGSGRLVVSSGLLARPSSDVYEVGVDGRTQRRLTSQPNAARAYSNVSHPIVSPDGTRIAYSRELGSEDPGAATEGIGLRHIYVMNRDGSAKRALTRGKASDSAPAWSPDGTSIAFVRLLDPTGRSAIHVMNADGSGVRRLTDGRGADEAPTWSPDGQRIAFAGFNGSEDIYVMNADGSGRRRLTHGPAYDGTPDWSPDGQTIVFARDGHIFVMRPDGSDARALTRGPGRDTGPKWSRDGSLVAFTRSDAETDQTFPGPGRAIIVRQDGSQLRRVKPRLEGITTVDWAS